MSIAVRDVRDGSHGAPGIDNWAGPVEAEKHR